MEKDNPSKKWQHLCTGPSYPATRDPFLREGAVIAWVGEITERKFYEIPICDVTQTDGCNSSTVLFLIIRAGLFCEGEYYLDGLPTRMREFLED